MRVCQPENHTLSAPIRRQRSYEQLELIQNMFGAYITIACYMHVQVFHLAWGFKPRVGKQSAPVDLDLMRLLTLEGTRGNARAAGVYLHPTSPV